MIKLDLAKAVVGVIGLGYIGLPIAEAFSKSMKVIGFDINTDKIRELRKSKKNGNLVFSTIEHCDLGETLIVARLVGLEPATSAFAGLRSNPN